MSARTSTDARTLPGASTPGSDKPIYVWQLPVRIAHWTMVCSIIVLAVTGYYIYRPFIAPGTTSTGVFLMAKVRYVHELTAFIFTAAVLLRLYWGFAGNRYSRWTSFLPLHQEQWQRLAQTLGYYLLIRRKPPHELGHNPLASLFYVLVYTLSLLQILTGFALFAWVFPVAPWASLFGWLPRVMPIQDIRLAHFLLMFAFIAFTIHHVYSSVIWDSEQRNGLLSSMITGFKRSTSDVVPRPGESRATIGYWIERARHRAKPSVRHADGGSDGG
jgi:Ni/Fe-hydrogenase 1 B-type cytochrome subunit